MTVISPADFYVGNTFSDLSIMGFLYDDETIVQTDWTLEFTNGIKLVSVAADERIYMYTLNEDESGEEYDLEMEIPTKYHGSTIEEYIEFMVHSWVIINRECTISYITGNPDLILGKDNHYVCYLTDGPEEGDTEDMFTFVFKYAELQ